MKLAEPSRGICLCGCTPFWEAHWELFVYIVFKKDLTA